MVNKPGRKMMWLICIRFLHYCLKKVRVYRFHAFSSRFRGKRGQKKRKTKKCKDASNPQNRLQHINISPTYSQRRNKLVYYMRENVRTCIILKHVKINNPKIFTTALLCYCLFCFNVYAYLFEGL